MKLKAPKFDFVACMTFFTIGLISLSLGTAVTFTLKWWLTP